MKIYQEKDYDALSRRESDLSGGDPETGLCTRTCDRIDSGRNIPSVIGLEPERGFQL